jgi:hypothetical protein
MERDIYSILEKINGVFDMVAATGFFNADELEDVEILERELRFYVDTKEGKSIKYFVCPHCGMQLENQRNFFDDIWNLNEFWCSDCDKIYIIEEDGEIIEEDSN